MPAIRLPSPRFAVSGLFGAALLCSLLASPVLHAQVTFPVSFDSSANGLTPTERANLTSHLQAAGQDWANLLGITAARSIEIRVEVDDSIATFGGSSFTSSFVGVIQGRDTFEQGAAAELRNGVDPNGATPDVRIIASSIYLRNELFFDPDPTQRTAPVPNDKTDAMSVALHELGHALAYNGFADGAGVPPAGFWSPFDRWMLAGSPTLFDGPTVLQVRGSRPDLTTNNIFHWSNEPIPMRAGVAPQTVRWNSDGTPIPNMVCGHVPSQDAPLAMRGPSGGPPPGLLSELMNGIVFFRGHRYFISALDLATLADVGLPPLAGAGRIFASGFEPLP